MKSIKPLPEYSYLKECFDYNPLTGELRWNVRPIHHFTSWDSYHKFNNRFANKIAGSITAKGYLRIMLDYSEIKVHRICWKLFTERNPECLIDHINGCKIDNRIVNLREATSSQNAFNSKMFSNNTSGFKGVFVDRSQIRAGIRVEDKFISLGTFSTKEEAAEAYKRAATRYFGKFSK
jgi:hypothetical protein